MFFDQFKESLSAKTPPENISAYLKALWFDAKGNREKAHTVIQDTEDNTAAWIHAYLHRKEGDIANADYWYSRAGKIRQQSALHEEWETLVNYF